MFVINIKVQKLQEAKINYLWSNKADFFTRLFKNIAKLKYKHLSNLKSNKNNNYSISFIISFKLSLTYY